MPSAPQKDHQSFSDPSDGSDGDYDYGSGGSSNGAGGLFMAATNGDHGGEYAPLPPAARWVPSCLRFDHGPMEATGLAVDNWVMGPIFMSSMFLGPALLELATEAAGCVYDESQDTICDNKVYGFRPSSLLTNMAVASGLLVPICLPFVGAIVDHTPYRKQVAAAAGIWLAVVKAFEIGVGPRTWFVITILQVTSSILYNIHVTATYAYNSELSSSPEAQANYNSFYSMVQYVSMVVFLVAVLVTSGILEAGNVQTARISQTFTSVTALILFTYSWYYLFRDRPATAVVRPGQNLLTSGFAKESLSFAC